MLSGAPNPALPQESVALDAKKQAKRRLLIGALLFCCLFLQRFGVPFGDQALNIVGPIGLLIAVAGLLSGVLALQRGRLLIYLLLLTLVAVDMMYNSVGLPAYNAQTSTPSILQFLGITGFAIFVFAEPMDEEEFFRLINKFMLMIAVAGIIQFFIQFAGVQIFSFTGFLPASMLAETFWNMQISTGIGELYKSNGFFLVEPSVMSQFMAMAIIIEMLYFRRLLYLSLLGLGFVLAFSGTGGLVLFGFVLAVALRLGLRGLMVAVLLLLFGAVAAGAVMFISPGIADTVAGRLSEFSTPGTSGFNRFVTPFWLISDALKEYPMSALFGIGGGTSEHLTVAYDYNVNTPIKIALEYGFPVLTMYFALFLVATRTPRQSVLVVPAFVLLMFTGGYQQFGPIVYLITLMICTARLSQSEGGPSLLLPAELE